MSDSDAPRGLPSVGIFLGDAKAAANQDLEQLALDAAVEGLVIIPVLTDLAQVEDHVPLRLRHVNGFQHDPQRPESLVSFVLSELGIAEPSRKVFISHRRADGLGAAEQLHDKLSHARFMPFIDRFAILPGESVQRKIADSLEEHAFLLLLETPDAHGSDWVFDEVEYALSHAMGILILQWPGVIHEVAGTTGLHRYRLTEDDLSTDEHDYSVLTEAALERTVGEIEREHAAALVRRRRYLVRSIEEAALASGAKVVPLPGWRVLVEHRDQRWMIGTTPRLPSARDLESLDRAAGDHQPVNSALLVHSARDLETTLRTHLTWVANSRPLRLVPENAVGAEWTP